MKKIADKGATEAFLRANTDHRGDVDHRSGAMNDPMIYTVTMYRGQHSSPREISLTRLATAIELGEIG